METIIVNGREREVLDARSSGPGTPTHTYLLNDGDYLLRRPAGDGWILDARRADPVAATMEFGHVFSLHYANDGDADDVATLEAELLNLGIGCTQRFVGAGVTRLADDEYRVNSIAGGQEAGAETVAEALASSTNNPPARVAAWCAGRRA